MNVKLRYKDCILFKMRYIELHSMVTILCQAETMGPGTKDQGQGTRDQGPRTRDQGPGTRDQGPGTKDQGQGTKDQGPRTRDQGPRIKNQGPRTKDQEPRTRDQGPGTRDKGPRTRDQGPRTRDQGPGQDCEFVCLRSGMHEVAVLLGFDASPDPRRTATTGIRFFTPYRTVVRLIYNVCTTCSRVSHGS